MADRLYLAYVWLLHVAFFGHRPAWALPGLWCQECAFRRLH